MTATTWTSGPLVAPAPTTPAVRAVMHGNRKRNTQPELLVRSELHRRGLRFRKDYRVVLGKRSVRADVVFTRQRVAVFIDGCFWHRCPDHGTSPTAIVGYWRSKLDRNVARDLAQTSELEASGWLVLRAWEHEPPGAVADRVVVALRAVTASICASGD